MTSLNGPSSDAQPLLSVGSRPIHDVQSQFITVQSHTEPLTLSRWKALERRRLAIERELPCWRKHLGRSGLALILFFALGVALCFTVFRSALEPHWHDILRYGSIPVVSTLFTYAHIWLALHMTFYPLEFIGLYEIWPGIGLGWQGIIPMKAARMAEKAVDLMTQKLIKVQDVFARIEPAKVAAILEPTLHHVLTDLIHEVAMQQSPELWMQLPAAMKEEVVKKACEDTPEVITAMMRDVKDNIEDVFDLKEMVVTALVEDKALLCEMFQKCGKREFKYIKFLGAKIGCFFGILQMIVWIYYEAIWVLPVTGFLVGYLTNWLALKMIFEPVEPVDVCGCYTLHGLFLKRQVEVSAEYAHLVVKNILNADNIIAAIIRGPSSDRLFAIISKHVMWGVDKYAGMSKTVVQLVLGTSKYQRAKNLVCNHIIANLGQYLRHIETYTDEAMDLENTLFDRMTSLSSADFEALLHPVFEEDEWKLIILGGLLGVIVGFIQGYALGS